MKKCSVRARNVKGIPRVLTMLEDEHPTSDSQRPTRNLLPRASGVGRCTLRQEGALVGRTLLLVCLLALTGCATAPHPSDEGSLAHFLDRSRAEQYRLPEWEVVRQWTFDDPAELEDMKPIQSEWSVRDGRIENTGGGISRTLLVAPCRWNPVRIEFDAILHARPDGRVCDISIKLNADPERGRAGKGYWLVTASYWNQVTTCYRLNLPIARTEYSPIVPGKMHHVALEFLGDHLRFWVDDEVVLDAWDRQAPLAMDPEAWIGIGTYDTRMTIDNLTISGQSSKDEDQD